MSHALRRDLEAAIAGEVRFDRVSRALYATDASVYQIEPLGVVLPRTAEDVVAAVRIAARHGVSITPRGGGTSQAGQAIGAGLVLDTSKYLNRILAIDPDRRTARVEPGVVLDDLNAALRPHGLRFAPDVSSASRATVGGMMANNSSGARSVIYGKTIDHVRAQRVALADGSVADFRPLGAAELARRAAGDSLEARALRAVPALARRHAAEIERRFPKILRRVGGYNLDAFVDPASPVDLTKLVVGSEGTLGFILDATLRLVPLPAAKALLAVEFADLLEALGATPLVLRHGPSAVEVMDDFVLGHAREQPALDALRRSIVSQDGSALLCVEFYADRADELPDRLAGVERELAAAGVRCRTRRVMDPAAQARVWGLREAALGLSMATPGDAKAVSFVEDTAVAPERLRDYIARFLEIVRRHDTVAGVYAHASVGCLHVRPVVDLKTDEGVRRFEAIATEVADLVLEFGGALSGEHGDGLVRGAFTEKMFGSELYEAFRTIKRTFDPQGIFNPGRIVDTPPITAHLRFGPGYRTPERRTYFDYGHHGGFARAVEMCSGVGACRKTREGTMCPSFMATREEAHSTRGRANALRWAMSGRLGDAGLTDRGVYDVLDLCLECRACRTECPTGVDMARFKSEFLAAYWERHGTSLRARAFAAVPDLAAWGSRLAPLANLVAGSRVGRRLGEALLGLDSRRPPPVWAGRTFRQLAAGRRSRGRRASTEGAGSSRTPRAVVFADTFTNHIEPDIGLAALEVLDRAGIEAGVVPHGCCGRPLISQGFLFEARRLAEANVAHLAEAAARGEAIVFLEPSCLSAVREDAPALVRASLGEQARLVASQAVLFEEFLERELSAGRASLQLRPGPAAIALHAHCHQRAMGLAAPALDLLGRIPGCTVSDLDAGCCGMAGSFGYAREHYELSRAIGERKLLPAARALGPNGVLVASGTSCRHQVAHFAGVRARHPATLLASLLTESP